MEDVATVNSGGNSAETPAAPASFEQVFASEVSPAPEPSTQVLPDASAAAQPTPGQETSPQQGDERSPFIPRPRFDEVNTERNALKEWKQQHAWAEHPEVREVIDRIAHSKGDPMAFFAQQFQELANHPVHSQALRSFLGQQFGALRQRQPQPQQTAQPPEPDVAITDAQGNVVGRTYSAEAQAQREAWLKQQWMGEVQQAFAPKLQTLDQMKAERDQAAADAQAESFATATFQELSALPGFNPKQHGPLLAEELRKLNLPDGTHPSVVEAAALRAYTKVVLPTLNATAQSQLLDTLQQKATASTAINPGSAAPTSRANITSFSDKALTW